VTNEGTLHRAGGRYSLGFERLLAHATEKVREVLTDNVEPLATGFLACEGTHDQGAKLGLIDSAAFLRRHAGSNTRLRLLTEGDRLQVC
jgi:hypothetical protein